MASNLKKRILSSFLALSILVSLSGCKNNKKDEEIETPKDTFEDLIPASNVPVNDDVHNMDKKALDDLTKAIDDCRVYYEYDFLYPTKEDVLKLSYSSGEEIIHEAPSDLKDTLQRVVENVKNNYDKVIYLQFKDYFEYDVLENGKKVKHAIDLYELFKKALESTFLNATNDVAEDLCVLEDIALVVDYGEYDDNAAMVYSGKDNLLIVRINTIIRNFEKDDPKDYDTELEEILYEDLCHEISHVRQDFCKHHEKDKPYMSINKNTGVPTYIETSAESSLYTLNIVQDEEGHFYRSYSVEREQEALWLLIGVTNPNVEDYYNAIFDADIDAFYKFFGLESANDKVTFHKVLYAIDSLNGRTNFLNSATGKKEMLEYQLEELVGYDYRTDIFRLALKNLAEYTCENPNFTLEENLLLFDIIKTMVSEDTYSYQYDSEENTKCDITMANNFFDLNSSYFLFLKKVYGVSLTDIKELEKTNSRRIYDLISLANGEEISLTEEESEKQLNLCQEMIAKFPVLKTIFFSKPYLFYDNYSLLDAAKEVVVKRILAK